MQPSLVLELQSLAADRNTDIVDVLRKALMVARKLGLDETAKWIDQELDGYKKGEEVPAYRQVVGQFKAYNPTLRRLIPYYLPSDMEEKLTKIPVSSPISALAEKTANQSTGWQVQLNPQVRDALLRGQQDPFPMEPVLDIPPIFIRRIVEAVRDKVLRWSLELEKEGIMGEGKTFTPVEKDKASHTPAINIGVFQGVLGNITNSEFVQNLKQNVKQNDRAGLLQELKKLGIDQEDLLELSEALERDPAPTCKSAFGPAVSVWIGNMVKKAALGTWKFGVDVAGGVLSSAISSYYGIG